MSGGYLTGHITKDGRAMEAFYAVVNLTGRVRFQAIIQQMALVQL